MPTYKEIGKQQFLAGFVELGGGRCQWLTKNSTILPRAFSRRSRPKQSKQALMPPNIHFGKHGKVVAEMRWVDRERKGQAIKMENTSPTRRLSVGRGASAKTGNFDGRHLGKIRPWKEQLGQIHKNVLG